MLSKTNFNPFLAKKIFTLVFPVFLFGCTKNIDLVEQTEKVPIHFHQDICKIFSYNEEWKKAAFRTQEKWGVKAPVVMAFVYQESRFTSTAQAKTSSAFGYAQALNGTWQEYLKHTNRHQAKRNKIKDAFDFIGWYNTRTKAIFNLPEKDVKSYYLAYHEGHKGFKSKSFNHKPWLLTVAQNVENMALTYNSQIKSCD
jgi:hypothetical protein